MNAARSLELFFIDGRPDGMLTAQVFNWTGHVLRIPRTQLKDGLARKEARFTGVYVLLGDQNGAPLAYVGEAEDMGTRLRQHAGSKDWWDTAILITTSADNLHKAHVRYLEARLIEIAKDVAATALENGNQPGGSSLSEADRANMESFLDTLMMVLPAIRVDNFLNKKRTKSEVPVEKKTEMPIVFAIQSKNGEVDAKAVLRDGEMVVLKGSKVRSVWGKNRSEKSHYWKWHDALVADGTISNGELMADYAFPSPSGAASVVTGRSASGRREWIVVGTNQTYADWEAAQLAEAEQ